MKDRVLCLWNRIKKNRWELLLACTTLLMCIIHAIPAGGNADFNPINGDFQNYNVVRRFLDGQVPYRDFMVYLGYGHLLLGSIMTFLFGGGSPTLMSSKIAFSFCTTVSFVIILYIICRAVLKKYGRVLSLAVINVFLLVLFINPLFFSQGLIINSDFLAAIQAVYAPGNSARMLRGMAPAVFVVLVILIRKVLNRVAFVKKREYLVEPLAVGISSGMIIYYSNDHGLACAICAVLLFIITKLFEKSAWKKKLTDIGVFFSSMIIAFFLFGELITAGHIGSYIARTFGTGGAQMWYYYMSKASYLYDVEWRFWLWLQAFLSLIYLILLIKNREKVMQI